MKQDGTYFMLIQTEKVADSIMDQANKLGINEHIEEISVIVQNITEVKRGVINTERKIFLVIYYKNATK